MNTPWASIAKIEADGEHSGTGFLVTPRHVLTARHVIADSTGRPFPKIWLRFFIAAETGGLEPPFETGAQVVPDLSSGRDDFALLLCDAAPPSRPLRLTDGCLPFHNCFSPGFAVQNPAGFTVIGRISSPNDPVEPSGTAIGIQFDFGSGLLMKGHSGAPVFLENRVVGLLRTAFLDEKEKTAGGIVHATPVTRVVELCNRQAPGMLSYHASVIWPNPSPGYSRTLADRRDEFDMFERMITGQTKERAFFLIGESGSGKTVLAHELLAYAKTLGIHVTQVDCKGRPAMDSVFSSLMYDLGPQFLPAAAAANGDLRYFNMIQDLTGLEQPLVLAIDTWQQSSEEVQRWMERALLPNLARMPAVVLMIGGQEVPNAKGTTWSELASPRHIGVIRSAQDWLEYTQRRWPDSGIEKKHVDALTTVAGGQPNTMDVFLESLQRGLSNGDAAGGSA